MFVKSSLRWVLVLTVLPCLAAVPVVPDFAGEQMRVLDDPDLTEVSGLALSGPGRFWAVNDSGNAPRLLGFDAQGVLRERPRIEGAQGFDWEDLAHYRQDGQAWLAIADIGDNFAIRSEVEILLLPAPAPGTRSLRPARQLRVRYEDGPRDAEALAVDAEAGQILILEKRRPPAALYALDLAGPEQQRARRIAVLPDLWPEAPLPVHSIGDLRFRGAATAMDLSPDGRRLAILSYSHLYLLRRAAGESWDSALLRPPVFVSRLPRRVGGLEAVAWDPDGQALWLMPEGRPAPLFRLPLPAQ